MNHLANGRADIRWGQCYGLMLTLAALATLIVACSSGDEVEPPAPIPASPAPSAAASTPEAPDSSPISAPAPTVAAPTSAPASPQSAPATPTALPAPGTAVAPPSVSIQGGTVARYVVGEQLARLPTPIDAVGETSDVDGAIVFNEDGSIDPEQSRITVGLAGLTSDETRRDRWVRNQLFNTSQYPNAELAVSELAGLPWPLPESGAATFQLTGDLTIRDVTRQLTWDVTAEFSGTSITGQATTEITFELFELSKPTFGFIISVDDDIRLELDIVATVDSI